MISFLGIGLIIAGVLMGSTLCAAIGVGLIIADLFRVLDRFIKGGK